MRFINLFLGVLALGLVLLGVATIAIAWVFWEISHAVTVLILGILLGNLCLAIGFSVGWRLWSTNEASGSETNRLYQRTADHSGETRLVTLLAEGIIVLAIVFGIGMSIGLSGTP